MGCCWDSVVGDPNNSYPGDTRNKMCPRLMGKAAAITHVHQNGHVCSFLWSLLDTVLVFAFAHEYEVAILCLAPRGYRVSLSDVHVL